MRSIEEIILNKVSTSILDKDSSTVVFTDSELELTEETYEYFERHILKCLNYDDAKAASFNGEENILQKLCKEIFADTDFFMGNSKRISQYFFKCMSNEEKEAPGDLATCLFEGQAGKYIAILKLDFSDSYSHYVKQTEKGVCVAVGKSKTGLPSTSQKPSKAVLIRDIREQNYYDMLIIDKQKDGYFTNSFIKCSYVMDSRETTKTFQKVSEAFARKAFKDNAQAAEEFRSRITDTLINANMLDIENIADSSLEDEAVKSEYKTILETEGLRNKQLEIDKEWVEKKLKKKRLKVDNNIELYIDNDTYKDKDKFQIKRNGDGTIDVILRNVKNYIEK